MGVDSSVAFGCDMMRKNGLPGSNPVSFPNLLLVTSILEPQKLRSKGNAIRGRNPLLLDKATLEHRVRSGTVHASPTLKSQQLQKTRPTCPWYLPANPHVNTSTLESVTVPQANLKTVFDRETQIQYLKIKQSKNQ